MSVTIRTVERERTRRPHQFRLEYIKESGQVPPLRRDLANPDPARNHFLRSAVCLFLALRDGKPVGRVLAGIDRNE